MFFSQFPSVPEQLFPFNPISAPDIYRYYSNLYDVNHYNLDQSISYTPESYDDLTRINFNHQTRPVGNSFVNEKQEAWEAATALVNRYYLLKQLNFSPADPFMKYFETEETLAFEDGQDLWVNGKSSCYYKAIKFSIVKLTSEN